MLHYLMPPKCFPNDPEKEFTKITILLHLYLHHYGPMNNVSIFCISTFQEASDLEYGSFFQHRERGFLASVSTPLSNVGGSYAQSNQHPMLQQALPFYVASDPASHVVVFEILSSIPLQPQPPVHLIYYRYPDSQKHLP